MTDLHTAARQALEALEAANDCPVWPNTLKQAAQIPEAIAALRAALEAPDRTAELISQKDGAYLERNRCVALIARMALALGRRVGVTETAIEGWSEDWHGCIYIDLPTGQVSWHFHDSQAYLFEGLPRVSEQWDGHDTPEKYRRVDAAYQGAALEAQQEPVAWQDAHDHTNLYWRKPTEAGPDVRPLYAHPPAQPQGWVLVPVEPTPEMLNAAGTSVVPAGTEWLHEDARQTWKAMLAARPKETT